MAKQETTPHAPETTAPAFKVKRNITLPLLKPQLEVPVYIKITGQIFTGKAVQKAGDGKDMEPAKIVNCINLETGEECQIIVPSVLDSILNEEFTDNAYVGKGFQITKHAKVAGKRYHTFSVAELEL